MWTLALAPCSAIGIGRGLFGMTRASRPESIRLELPATTRLRSRPFPFFADAGFDY